MLRMQKGPMDILTQTLRNEGFLALYKGILQPTGPHTVSHSRLGMASPLLGIAGVNSLLFAAYGASKRVISPFPELSLQQTALAGSMAGAANAILASPGRSVIQLLAAIQLICILSGDVQGSYAGPVRFQGR